ncbi:MAG: HWE histidine kinase domain-containing protein [Pseudomonadota bacterium]
MTEVMDNRVDDDTLAEALKTCDSAPIHIPGSIQGFGYLFATDRDVDRIEAVSDNYLQDIGADRSDVLGRAPRNVLPESVLHDIRNVLSHDTSAQQREAAGAVDINGVEHHVSVHRRGRFALIELLPERAPINERFAPMEEARRFLRRDPHVRHPHDILRNCVGLLRALVGYDRVKAYVFLPGADGEVIAEAKRADMPSFLGLRFPSSDIPKQARALYARTPIRVISNVPASNVAVHMADASTDELDLSLAILRGTDPVHTRYLLNMGLTATMSVPVVVEGELYALFACHHDTPRAPDASALMAAELAGKLISLQVEHAVELQRQTELRRCSTLASKIFVADDSELSSGINMAAAAGELVDALPCDGVVLSVDGALTLHGSCPNEPTCHAMFALGGYSQDGVLSLNELSRHLPGANWGATAGALMLSISATPDVKLGFLRNISASTVLWAGAPEKDIETTADGIRLNPRHSFDKYVQSVEARCDDWSTDDFTVAKAMRNALLDAFGTQQELRDQRHRLGLLVRELNHRVRNILSLVQSLSVQSRASATSIEHYAELLEKRIIALSGAHNLLTRSNMSGVELRELAELEFQPYAQDPPRTVIGGPDVWLRPDAGPIIALILHELTSNAAKHGALSNALGTVHFHWRHEREGLLIQWRENGGPPVTLPEKQGFGRSIIEHALPYEAGGEAQLRFAASGVEADLWLPGEMMCSPPNATPMRALSESDSGAKTATGRPSPAQTTERPALVVEDNYLVAVEAQRLLNAHGFEPVHTVSSVPEALARIASSQFEFCLLDVNLQGTLSLPVATTLQSQGTPFAFATGYGSEGAEIADAFDVPVLAKPVDSAKLIQILKEVAPHGR